MGFLPFLFLQQAGLLNSMAKKKFYAVAVGRVSGIYTDWASAEKQVKGFAGAKYKSFPTKAEAEAWCENPVYSVKKKPASDNRNESTQSLPTSGVEGRIYIYTDGGCSGNPGPGGYGTVILDGDDYQEFSEGFQRTTNNRMELLACIVGLQMLKNNKKPVQIFSDSSYVVNSITKGWAAGWKKRGWRKSDGEQALNIDLWKVMLALCEKNQVTFTWVKGHAGHELNERCDRLAVAASQQQSLKVDKGFLEQ